MVDDQKFKIDVQHFKMVSVVILENLATWIVNGFSLAPSSDRMNNKLERGWNYGPREHLKTFGGNGLFFYYAGGIPRDH